MFTFDMLMSFSNKAGIMVVSAFACYALGEILKALIKGDEWRDYMPFAVYALAFAVYLAIAKTKGYAMPIPTALVNALLFLIIEISAFVIIKGVGKLVKAVVDWLKERIGK